MGKVYVTLVVRGYSCVFWLLFVNIEFPFFLLQYLCNAMLRAKLNMIWATPGALGLLATPFSHENAMAVR